MFLIFSSRFSFFKRENYYLAVFDCEYLNFLSISDLTIKNFTLDSDSRLGANVVFHLATQNIIILTKVFIKRFFGNSNTISGIVFMRLRNSFMILLGSLQACE